MYGSAFATFHCTETALPTIQNDITISIDSGIPVGLILLEISAAISTVDYSIILDCVQQWYVIDGVVLKWIESYLDPTNQQSQ